MPSLFGASRRPNAPSPLTAIPPPSVVRVQDQHPPTRCVRQLSTLSIALGFLKHKLERDQGGLGMPDREYYLDEKHAEVKFKYHQYIQAQAGPGLCDG